MTGGGRIVLNVIATYGRSLYALVVGLFCARWVLLSLGEVDFGLFGVIGGLISVCAVFNALMSSATTRFFAVAIGESAGLDPVLAVENCRKWFNVAAVAHAGLAVLLLAIGYPVGVWAIENWLTIPPGRIADCVQVFRISALAAFVSMVNVPFNGMFIAKQEIAEQSLYSSLQTTFGFCVGAYMITHPGDWLVAYAALFGANTVVPEIVICVRAWIKYPECRFRPEYMRDCRRLWQMVKFALCQSFTGIGFICCNQGMNILVNRLFGPAVNASMGVATKVNAQATSLTGALGNAFRPAIATAWGAGNLPEVVRLSFVTTKFALFCALLFIVPLVVGIDDLLVVWLKTPPPHSDMLCVFFMAAFVVDMLACGQDIAVNASGKIARYQFWLGLCWMSSLPIALCVRWFGGGVASVGIALILVFALSAMIKLVFAKRLIGMRILPAVACDLKILAAAVLGIGAGILPRMVLPGGPVSALIAMTVAFAVFVPAFFVFATTGEERRAVVAKTRCILKTGGAACG